MLNTAAALGLPARKICLTIAYDGAAYSGWQLQPIVPTVQGAVEAVLRSMTGDPCRLRGAGRTDAGVHAAGQLAVFRTDSRLTCDELHKGLNALLPDDVCVTVTEECHADFDPRRDNSGKHYRYSVWNARVLPPEVIGRCSHVKRPLDLATMAVAGRRLIGRHDFAAFQAADCDRDTSVRTIYRCTVSRRGPFVAIDVEGSAFLKNMVRIIAGTLIDIGRGRFQLALIDELLETGDRTRAGPTSPPGGLCLMSIYRRAPRG